MSPSLDAALQVPRVAQPGPEHSDEARRFQGIPGIERSGNGRLWAAWYSGGEGEGPDNYVLMASSPDGGTSWDKPTLLIDPVNPAVRAFDPCLWLDPENRLWLFWAQSLGLHDGRFGVWAMWSRSADRPRPSWSSPRRLSDGIMMNKPTLAANGNWHLPVSIWPASDTHHPPRYFHPGKRTGAWDVISRDSGKNFAFAGAANDQEKRIFDEHMLVERRDGSWWMLSRTKAGIWENHSLDGGHTWLPGRRSAVPHINSRFFIRRLISGRLLLVRHDAVATEGTDWPPRSHLTAFLSEDDGQTWKGGLLLDDREGVSYPDGTQMPDQTIHIIYDFGRMTHKEILLATFTEADVLSRKWRSRQARPRHLVNKAGK